MSEYQLVTLKNGLRLLMVPMPQVESTTVMVMVGAGSRHETRRVNGFFHFLEHMAFKGTKKRPSASAISTEIDSVGGEFNAFTGREMTAFYLKLAAKHQGLAFDVLSDMMSNSLFKPKEIEREKGVIIEELNMYEDIPMRRVQEIFVRLLYGDNPMGWDIGGEKESVLQIQRQDFLDYLDRFYFAPNMVVVVAGKLDPKKIQGLAQKHFGLFKRKGQKEKKVIEIDQKESRLKVIKKKTEQAHFCLGVPGFDYHHPDRFPLGVLSTVLGGGMSSRLFLQIRERRGLAYYVGCSPDYYTDSGFLMARAGVKLKQAKEAVKVMLDEFYQLAQKKVTDSELKKAKEFLKGRMILALEDSQQVATRYAGQILLEEKISTPKETQKKIDKVTSEDVLRVAKVIFGPNQFNLALIGPYQKEVFKKLFK